MHHFGETVPCCTPLQARTMCIFPDSFVAPFINVDTTLNKDKVYRRKVKSCLCSLIGILRNGRSTCFVVPNVLARYSCHQPIRRTQLSIGEFYIILPMVYNASPRQNTIHLFSDQIKICQDR